MENGTKSIELKDLSFPVFKLLDRPPTVKDGLVFYYSENKDLDSAQTFIRYRLIDDKNLPFATLGQRRLQLKLDKDAQIFPINKAIYFLGDLLKIAKTNTWFIDSEGQLFTHKKSNHATLTFRKIVKILPTKGMGAIVEVEGIPSRFKTIFRPRDGEEYAGILVYKNTFIFYGFYKDKLKDSWRKI